MSVFSLWKGEISVPLPGTRCFWLRDSIRDEVVRQVAAEFDVGEDEIYPGKGRERRVAHARQEAIFRLRCMKRDDGEPKFSYLELARSFSIDHTTAIHAVRAVRARRMAGRKGDFSTEHTKIGGEVSVTDYRITSAA